MRKHLFLLSILLQVAAVSVSAQSNLGNWEDYEPLDSREFRDVEERMNKGLLDISVNTTDPGFYNNIRISDNTIVPASAPVQREYVDLGLSVKWATCNLGADKPEGYGDYYAWGEAAHLNWVDGWRMPTKEEFAELFEKCEWADTIQNGVHGFLFTSKVPGYTSRYIFLPYNPDANPDANLDIIDFRTAMSYKDGIYLTSDLSSKFASLCVVLRFSGHEFGTGDDEIDLNIGWIDDEGILAGIKWSKIHITQYDKTRPAFIRPVCH